MGATARVSVQQHLLRIKELLEPVLNQRGTEIITLDPGVACGRVSAEDLTASRNSPNVDNSQMDGFALRAHDVEAALAAAEDSDTVFLPLSAVIAAGDPVTTLRPGSTAAVMTGAALPQGADLVIPVEESSLGRFPAGFGAGFLAGSATQAQVLSGTTTPPDSEQQLIGFTLSDPRQRAAGRFIRRAGSDISIGEKLIRQGELLSPAVLGLLASAGVQQLRVRQQLRILVVSCGAEINAPGSAPDTSGVFDANTPLISAALQGPLTKISTLRVTSDEVDTFRALLDQRIHELSPELIITAGGISAGAFEVIRQAWEPQGIEFTAIAQQPGGPQGWGVLDGSAKERAACPRRMPPQGAAQGRERNPAQPGIPEGEAGVAPPSQPRPGARPRVICLPGNPVSCAVSIESLIRPALAAVDPHFPAPVRIEATLADQVDSPLGITQYRRVRLERLTAGGVQARLLGGPSSHLLANLAAADGLAIIGSEIAALQPGDTCAVLLLPGTPPMPSVALAEG